MGRRGTESDLDSFRGLGERLAMGGGVEGVRHPSQISPSSGMELCEFGQITLPVGPFLSSFAESHNVISSSCGECKMKNMHSKQQRSSWLNKY